VTDTQILITACIATVAYAATFMVVFDRVLAWAESKATAAVAAETETAPVEAPVECTVRRPLRGLAAEPTVLPRAVSGLSRLSRPVVQKDDDMQGILGQLDAIPSKRAAMA